MSNPFYQSRFWKDLRAAALVRDDYRCTVKGCNRTRRDGRLYVDHIEARPYSERATSWDVLTNVRTLCEQHDQQVRQDRAGKRRSDGRITVVGCDASGLPLDPQHSWNR